MIFCMACSALLAGIDWVPHLHVKKKYVHKVSSRHNESEDAYMTSFGRFSGTHAAWVGFSLLQLSDELDWASEYG